MKLWFRADRLQTSVSCCLPDNGGAFSNLMSCGKSEDMKCQEGVKECVWPALNKTSIDA